MAFRNFKLNCIMRSLLLLASMALLCGLIFYTELYVATFVIGLVIAYQVWALVNYVEKTNRDLARFLISIQQSDFSQTYSYDGRGGSHEQLRRLFNDVVDEFRRTRTEKEEHYRYLQTVVQHIGVGLLAFQADGSVDLINTAVKRMFGLPRLGNVRDLEQIDSSLPTALFEIEPEERRLVRLNLQGERLHLSLAATVFRQRQQTFKLVSLQNITSELDEREMEAWQQLVRVLTHEIMNSVTPVASLASTVCDILSSEAGQGGGKIEGEALDDIRGAVGTIEKRSEGLIHFVNSYRSLTHIPNPEYSLISVDDLLDRVERLASARAETRHINFSKSVTPASLELTADTDLVEQVLLNLLSNATHALKGRENARIEIVGRLNQRGRVVIEVSDNGPGIDKEAQNRVFIPFFTTRPDGSGIGLSFSRQVMRLHKGDITVRSDPDNRTTFTLRF